jgi:nitrogen fixation NifU-like protein
MYTPLLLEHFKNARNVGELSDANAIAQVVNPACGDTLELSLRVDNKIVIHARFRAKGCMATIACASRLTEMIQGASLADAQNVNRNSLIASLGGLPTVSHHAAQLSIDALHNALGQVDNAPVTGHSSCASAKVSPDRGID